MGKSLRHEYKYVCDNASKIILNARIRAIMRPDSHIETWGGYRIRSLYFDDINLSSYEENAAGVDRRNKYRIRLYNGSKDSIFLECKSKYHDRTNKRAEKISIEQCKELMRGKPAVGAKKDSLLDEVNGLIVAHGLHPTIIIEYDRIPYIYKMGNVRITFDEKIGYSTHVGSFLREHIMIREIEFGKTVMEVKWDEYMPDYIYNALQIGKLSRNTFSKYYLCMETAINGGELIERYI